MTLADLFTSMANAIRAKGGTSATMYPSQMPQAIADIQPQISLQRKTKSYTPSETAQAETVAADAGYDGLAEVDVTVAAVPTMTLPSGVSETSSGTLKAMISRQPQQRYLNIPQGYNPTAQYYNLQPIPDATVTMPENMMDDNAAVSVPTPGKLRLTGTCTKAPVLSAPGYVGSVSSSAVQMRMTADVPTCASPDLTASGATVTAPAGYYASDATKTVASGTEGKPIATKGTVSNHAVTVTPSVTNTAGYIAGGTKTGTGVSVSASELVSGSETKTENGTYDVTNLAELVVNVQSGGTSKNAQVVQGTTRTTSSTATAIGAEMTVSKTGTYDVYWSAVRSTTSASYTYGTQLYIDGTAYGTENTAWSNHVQNNHLSNVSLTANQKIRVRGRNSRGSSYYIYAPTLVIVES